MKNKSSTWRKFRLLLWKGMVIRKRRWICSLLELLSPIIAFLGYALLIKYTTLLPKASIVEAKEHPKIDIKELSSQFSSSTKLCYYPTVGFTKDIIKKVQSKLKLNAKNVLNFKNESNFLEYFMKSDQNNSIFVIAFQELNGSSVPQKFVYLIRPYFEGIQWNTATLIDDDMEEPLDQKLGSSNYIQTGFLSLQIALEVSFLEIATRNILPFDIVVQEFPYPRHTSDKRNNFFFNALFFMFIAYGFIVTLESALSKPAVEKGTGINELMKTTGLSSWLIFLTWYFYYIIVNIISILLIILILMLPIEQTEDAIVKYSDFSILFLFLFLYCSAMIIFGLLVASRFDNETMPTLVGVIIWIVLISVSPKINIKNHKLKLFAGILPTYAGHHICKQIGMYESTGIGANWSNMHKTAQDNAYDLSISEGLTMLFVTCIIFSMLSLYIGRLYPGQYGVAKSYYFIIYYKAFWNKVVHPNKVDSEINLVSDNFSNTEPPSPNFNPGIRIQNLCKRYGKFRAVDNLSMDIYEGLITVLLGQNGAGKTTTMSIITGMIKATSGTVLINGEDIKYKMDEIRYSLGYCPQNDINFEDLNVSDHFIFFGMLKGLNKTQAKSQAMTLLIDLNLYDQRKKRAKELSGGMKRRLSLGIALMGNSKVLILDEPTSGLDPETRRELWDILKRLKSSHMIIITTHFMEEADALADRIAIIDHGHLTCYGSPMFLKKLYGAGYRLTITRDKKLFEERNPGKIQADTVTEVINGKLREATLLESNLNCLVYLLPYDKKSQYTAILDEVEKKKDDLCVTHIAMTVTTLEEVFLKSGSFAAKDETVFKFDLQSLASQDKKSKLFKLKLHALIKKRWLIFKKRYLVFLIAFFLGMMLCIATFHLTYTALNTKTSGEKEVKFDVQLDNYGRTTVYYSTNKKSGYFTKMRKKYDRLVEEQGSDAYETDDVHKTILDDGENNMEFYRKELIVAAEFMDTKPKKFANAMFSKHSLHGAVISINLLSNSILHTLKNEAHSITSSISPLPDNKFNSNQNSATEFDNMKMYWTVLFPYSLMILVLPFMILPHMENISKFKQLQLMCGVHPLLYWGVFYIMDLLCYLLWTFVMILLMLIYQNSTNGLFLFDQTSHCGTLMLIFVVYGLPVIPFTYLFSYIHELFNGIAWCFMLGMLVPLLHVLIVFGILPEWLNYLFFVYPQYGLFYLLEEFFNNAIAKYKWSMARVEAKDIQCKEHWNPCCDDEASKECFEFSISEYGEANNATIKLIMILSTFAYFAILLLLEKQCFQKLFEIIRLMICTEIKTTEEDDGNREDVKLQEERISEIMDRELKDQALTPAEDGQNILLVNKLEKTFNRVKVVKQVSFSVDASECFGLLGVNGAGKTTTFRMLTGNLPLLKGDCRIVCPSGKRFHLSKTSKKYFRNIGYCPQLNVNEEVLTGREILTFFGKLRGISQGLDREIENFAKCLAFDEVLNRPCGNYSGGNKRKLSIAVALIGLPPVILLDEPTSGVDPISRRAMWNTIQMTQNQSTKPAIVLTSHSMEECEILCNKIAILKAGKFHCYGTLAQLKSKYSQGFGVTLKLTEGEDGPQQLEKVNNLKLKFRQLYKDKFYLKDEEGSLLHYRIEDLSKKWSDIFKNMEQLQREFPIIEDYTIAETTLEQVFIKIAQSG